MFCLVNEKEEEKKKKKQLQNNPSWACCPDPHLCSGKCVSVCVCLYIYYIPSSQLCVFVYASGRFNGSSSKIASLLTLWWIVQSFGQ